MHLKINRRCFSPHRKYGSYSFQIWSTFLAQFISLHQGIQTNLKVNFKLSFTKFCKFSPDTGMRLIYFQINSKLSFKWATLYNPKQQNW